MIIIPAKKPQPSPPVILTPVPAKLPLVSLVVACLGQLRYTKELVASLEANAGCEYELILVDNGCPEGTATWAERRGIKAIRMGENVGVPRAYNAGVAAASGEIIGVWNNDMICHANGVAALARATFARGIAAQSAGLWTAHGTYAGQTMEAHWSDYADGYALMALRKVWDEVGPWDPDFWPSYCDDVDWGIRARLKGYDWTLVEGAVHHYGGQTSQHLAGINQHMTRNQGVIRDRYVPLGLGQRILVQRWGAHGDLLMTTPAIRGLKKQLPLARLHVHCHSDAGKVLLGNPYVDAVFETPTPSRAYTRTVNLNGAYERAQPHGVFAHPALAFCAEAKVEYDGGGYDLHLPPDLLAWARLALRDREPTVKTFIACGLRSGTRSKQNWHPWGWRGLADQLPPDHRLVALDAAPMPPLGHVGRLGVDEVAFYAHRNVVDLTGYTTNDPDYPRHGYGGFQKAMALVAACDGLIGVDSGLQHVAHAVGLPVVVLSAGAPLGARMPLSGRRAGFEGIAPCMAPGCQAPAACSRVDGPHCLSHVGGPEVWATWTGLMEGGDGHS